MIRVVIAGIYGRMGQEVVKAVAREDDLVLVGGVETVEKIKQNQSPADVPVRASLVELLAEVQADVLVDFTVADSAMGNITTALKSGIAVVSGVTGIAEEELEKIDELAIVYKTPVLFAPNFAIGAVLMMEFAKKSARFFNSVEIIELHHDKKLDSPSGTALQTARFIKESADIRAIGSMEKVECCRGGNFEGIRIHSVRLPGLLAHQEVIFGGVGQTLTIRHDSTSRESFMPGVILGIRKVRQLKGLVIGLDKILQTCEE